jgi:hypothetical protein
VLTSIDHIVLAVPDLDEAAADLESRAGLRATGGGRHEALGTANRLVWFGDSYAELLAVVDEVKARDSWLGGPALAALARGESFVTWAIRSDALDADVRGARASGARFGDPSAGERTRDDARIVRWRLAIPDRVGPAELPFLIQRDESSAEWTPADRSARSIESHPVGGPARLDVLELPTADVPGTILRYLRTYGIRFRPSLAGGGARDANVGRQLVRLRPTASTSGSATTSPAMPLIRLAAPGGDGRSVEALGVRWAIRPG